MQPVSAGAPFFAVGTFLKSKYLVKYPNDIHFALLWANHTNWCYATPCPTSTDPNNSVRVTARQTNDEMIDYAIANYFELPQYLRVDNKPALVLWSVENLKLGLTGPDGIKELTDTLTRWQGKAKAKGLVGLYFISEFASDPTMVAAGVQGLTAYHYAGNAGSAASNQSPTNPLKGTPIIAYGKQRWTKAQPTPSDIENDPQMGSIGSDRKVGFLAP